MTMNSIATPIWNEIAKTQELKTAWGKMAFKLDQDGMVNLVEKEYAELKKQGVPVEVCKAFLDLKPLLLENVAISQFIEETDSLHLRQALPEVITPDEAVILASMDQDLTMSQQTWLRELLVAELK